MTRSLATAALASALTFACTGIASAQDQILGEVRLFGFNFCPTQWAPANGQLLSIQQNTALFSLYGTIYGGNGTTTFGLPNLIGRAPYGSGSPPGQPIGALYGTSSVTLITQQLPAHTHAYFASSTANTTNMPSGSILSTFPTGQHIYSPSGSPADSQMNPSVIGLTGNNQPIQTQSPALAMTWCVAVVGIYPSRP
jgi:microcystin-dependent protein